MNHVADVNANTKLNVSFRWLGLVARGKPSLNFDRASCRLQRARELDEEGVARRFDLVPVVMWENGTQEPPMFFQQLYRERFVALGQRAVTDHVREHDGGKLALFRAGAHGSSPEDERQ